jgi:hypothetical protein
MNETNGHLDLEPLELMFLRSTVKARLEDLDQYHREHPNLPRQDDVVFVYNGLYTKLEAALPESLRDGPRS